MKSILLKTTQVQVMLMDKKGEMQNAYSPLKNLQRLNGSLGDFTSKLLNFNRYTPTDIIVTSEYDGSTNLIINDDKNNSKLINSRFSLLENNTFNIPVHYNNNATNIYEENTFHIDILMLKLYNKIPTLTFDGIYEGGLFKCGSYVFYFKYADFDQNLTNTIQESGIVQVHMGTPNTKKVRMGMQNENAGKIIKFTLSNIDSGFDYIRVFYERTSTDDSQAIIKLYFMIDQNFPIINNTCELSLNGAESTIAITKNELQTSFADLSTIKTQEIVENTLFVGNISAYELDFQALLQIAWRIIPSVETTNNIGKIDSSDYSFERGYGYYDVKNVYDNTGYWPGEFYRFGIVFIYNNNLLSPVFNIQGVDLQENNSHNVESFFQENHSKWEFEPEDGFFKYNTFHNSKGVVRLPKVNLFRPSTSSLVEPNVTRIKFNWENIIYKEFNNGNPVLENFILKDSKNPHKQLFDKYNIKGFFFVRLKRIPSIICLGMVIGLTDKDRGALPVIKSGLYWNTKSFLSNGRLLLDEGSTVTLNDEAVSTKALLVPDYDINEPTLNQFFTSLKYQLEKVGLVKFKYNEDLYYQLQYIPDSSSITVSDVKLTAIPKNTKIRTDGTNYFSSVAGTPDEPYKTKDVKYIWNKTVPQDLTRSVTHVRGIWGSFVGMSYDGFSYGDIVNIRLNTAKESNYTLLEFKKRFNDNSEYSAISSRYNVSDYSYFSKKETICSRGDCFQSIFTHRMMSNFIDPELPTNTKIVDPSCWAKNYLVRCTAEILERTHSNLSDDSGGFYIPSPVDEAGSIKSLIFAILTLQPGLIISASEAVANAKNASKNTTLKKFANEITLTFEMKVDPSEYSQVQKMNMQRLAQNGYLKKVDPKEQEVSSSGLNLKALFKADDKYELHGLAQINRADVNAVSFGQWITFPICSQYNLAFRDIEFNQTSEEAKMNKKRSFYPYEDINPENHLLESGIINGAAKVSVSDYNYPIYRTVPYIKQEYFNRIYWSKPNVTQKYINGYRMIYNTQYKEYNKEFGSITKLICIGSNLLVVFQHGIGIALIDKSPKTEAEASPYLPQTSILPTQVAPISKDFGSMWKDSVLRTPQGLVYGVDTVAKKIWRTNGQSLEFISDHTISKFLNDHIDLSEYDYNEYVGHINVKTHYNAFKHDVMFTYYKDIPMTKHTYVKITDGPDKDTYVICPIGSVFDKYNKTDSRNEFIWTNPTKDGDEYTMYKLEDNWIYIGVLDYIPVTYQFSNKDLQNIRLYPANESILCNTLVGIQEVLLIALSEDKTVGIILEYSGCHVIFKIGDAYYLDEVVSDMTNNILVTNNIDKFLYKALTFDKYDEIPYQKVDLSGNFILDDTLDPKPLIDKWEKGKSWNICYNEDLQKWTTFYDWIPLESCNVDNIFFSFDRDEIDDVLEKKQKEGFDPIEEITIGEKAEDGTFTNIEELAYLYMNKVFMDKAFTHNTKVYLTLSNSQKTTKPITKEKVSYISYYYLENDELSNPIKSINGTPIEELNGINKSQFLRSATYKDLNTNDKADNWKFVSITVKKNGVKLDVTIDFSESYKIAELRFHTSDPENVSDPILKYWNFRNSEGRQMYLWKHGMAGLYDNQGKIKPTNWYGKQHEFNFEFIVNDTPGILKIFNNLLIMSNKTAPYKFEYEVVGEGYDWYIYKDVIRWINSNLNLVKEEESFCDYFPKNTINFKEYQEGLTEEQSRDYLYLEVLSHSYSYLRERYPTFPELFGFDADKTISKLPYLRGQLIDQVDDIRYNPYPDKWRKLDGSTENPLKNYPSGKDEQDGITRKNISDSIKSGQYTWNTSDTCLIEDQQLNEVKVHTESLGQDMNKYGRLRGNMLYLEDSWKVEIRPVNFKYAYIDKNRKFVKTKRIYESRHRDKFLRVKIRYDGKDLVLILAISTLFDLSLA